MGSKPSTTRRSLNPNEATAQEIKAINRAPLRKPPVRADVTAESDDDNNASLFFFFFFFLCDFFFVNCGCVGNVL